jgi:exodeoxyribonuclease V gamma subunit
MFHVHSSNRFESLASLLVERIGAPREDVFAADQVVVPGSAMRRALTLAIADRHSVCANVEFSYLAHWLWQQVARLVPGTAAESPFDADSLAWRVHGAFGDAAFVRGHPRLTAYLKEAGADEVMRYELAVRTAGLLEQYVTYRPDWLVRWQRGERVAAGAGAETFALDEAWQADLWRRIATDLRLGIVHPLQAMADELARGGAALAREAGVPGAVHVFGLPAMAPMHLAGLQALGTCIDVHLYAINPCREFWFDVVDLKALARLESSGQSQAYEEGNRLLASWGKQAQSSLALLQGVCDGPGAQADEYFEEAGGGTLLARVQDAILDLRDLPRTPEPPGSSDRSIEVHVCHSLTRQLEVLHDHLLGLFKADPSLRPADVLVVTPKLEEAAPLVEAVFGTVPRERRIPFAITGRARSSVNAPVRAFLDLLSLAASRCTVTELFALLQQPAVARRFGLDDASLAQVRTWLLASGVHWGLDAAHVATLGLPPAGHTLADGLARLYLGYALPDDVREPFAGRLPCGSPEGSSAAALGAFRRFADELSALRRQLWHARSAQDWAEYLHTVADAFIAPQRGEMEDHIELHGALDALAASAARGAFADAIAAPVMRAALDRAFDDPARGGMPTGRVTFAAMPSLRNLPFRVICVIGLDDGAFPTSDRSAEFDLVAQAPRTGDRQRGTDQRNQFLDLLLAARSSVFLSYTGRSIRDNAVLPPSVLVSELLDVLPQGARVQRVVEHPLQPFSPAAFGESDDERLRSFDGELAQALRASLGAPLVEVPAAPSVDDEDEVDDDDPAVEPVLPFFPRPLAAPEVAWREVSAANLVDFFNNPSRYLLSRRMQLDVPRDEDELQDDEPFVPQPLDVSRMARRLLPALLRGAEWDDALALAQAGAELPPGTLGDAERERELRQLFVFARRARAATGDALLPPHHARARVDIDGETWSVDAGFADLRPDGIVRWSYARESAYDLLVAGIHHLVLCADPAAGARPSLTWLWRDSQKAYDPMPPQAARDALAGLLRLYRRGLTEPLPFAPRTGWKLVADSESAARSAWSSGDYGFSEKDKPGYALALRGRPDPFDAGLLEIATEVFTVVRGRSVPVAGEST